MQDLFGLGLLDPDTLACWLASLSHTWLFDISPSNTLVIRSPLQSLVAVIRQSAWVTLPSELAGSWVGHRYVENMRTVN